MKVADYFGMRILHAGTGCQATAAQRSFGGYQ